MSLGGGFRPTIPVASGLIILFLQNMSNAISPIALAAIKAALSPARISTYEHAKPPTSVNDPSSICFYEWNSEVSAAFLAPLHIFEVVLRNAVSDALEQVYGPQWPWSGQLIKSLPNPSRNYSPQNDLVRARQGVATVGKVIPELKFVFWQNMFTGRHDTRVWNMHLHRIMPHLDKTKAVSVNRKMIYDQVDRLRTLRNRIAHHEPIFTRNLADDYIIMHKLVGYRCQYTAAWLDGNQITQRVIAAKP